MSLDWQHIKPKLSNLTLNALKSIGYEKPLEVQYSVIPLILAQKDLAVEAVTGSGKTLAFVIPLFEMLLKKVRSRSLSSEIVALIISPTYELAVQIHDVISKFIPFYLDESTGHLFTSLVFSAGGGVSMGSNQKQNFRRLHEEGATILIATPGRLTDLLRAGPIVDYGFGNQPNPVIRGLRSVEFLILDEADHLLTLGFEAQLNVILSFLPKQRRTSLFSATQTKRLDDLVRAGLRNPVILTVSEHARPNNSRPVHDVVQRTPSGLRNYYTVVEADAKIAFLLHFLLNNPNDKVLIFLSTCCYVNYIYRLLQHLLPSAFRGHVKRSHAKRKSKRLDEYNAFKNDPRGILICTDVMARGVDIPTINWVIQFDPPTNANGFLHRCGRTARCGFHGNALLLLTDKELAYVNFLQLNQQVNLVEMESSTLDGLLGPSDKFSTNQVIQQIRAVCQRDKLIYDLSIRAFVSYVRFYQKHECNLILNLKNLDFGKLANGFGLLRLPRMPELRTSDTSSFIDPGIDISQLKYRDKSVAKQRAKLEEIKIARRLKMNESRKNRRKTWKEKRLEKRNRKLAKQKRKAEKVNDEIAVNN